MGILHGSSVRAFPLFVINIYLGEERELPSPDSLPQCQEGPGLGQVQSRELETHSRAAGTQGLGASLCFPGPALAGNWGPESEAEMECRYPDAGRGSRNLVQGQRTALSFALGSGFYTRAVHSLLSPRSSLLFLPRSGCTLPGKALSERTDCRFQSCAHL